MRRPLLLVCLCLASVLASGCECDTPPPTVDAGDDAGPPDPPAPAPFTDVEETGRFPIPNLEAQAHVVRTEMDVPHIYAESRTDAMRVLGFTMALDRYFQMDLTARLSQGTLSELLGDAALETDLENRQTGATHMVDIYLASVNDEEAAELDAFADGVNAYIAAVRSGDARPPRELEIGAPLLGATRPEQLMPDWDRRDVAATGSTILYGTSFETGDVGRDRSHSRPLEDFFSGFHEEDLRRTGLLDDIINRYAPPNDNSSAPGWGVNGAGGGGGGGGGGPAPGERVFVPGGPHVEVAALDRMTSALARIERRLHPNGHEGWGSNSWAVMGSGTTDGRSLLAGDGHLQLSVPALFWQYGLDTVHLGDADGLRLMGGTIAGLPLMGIGTNGRVAWTQTAYFADVTDWYAEEIVLDGDGAPTASRFEGSDRPLVAVDDVFDIADVPALESVGRVETVRRYTTFDGRFITSIEGRELADGEEPGSGETAVNLMGSRVVPADMDNDGVISAVSFYYGPFDGGSLLRAFRGFADADNVEDFRQSMRHFIGYGGSMMASDADGSVLYSAYHAVPCRDHLPRDAGTNEWEPGADPRRLIDGTRFGAWSIPLDASGRVDETAAAAGGPTACAVPFDEWPQAVDPAQQYVMHANNDPGAIATDGDLFNDPYYIGGPWIEGYRARRIEQRLGEMIGDGGTTLEEQQGLQGDHHSQLGEDYASLLLEVIDAAQAASAGTPDAGSPEERMAAMYDAQSAAFDEVEARMIAWQTADFPTPSGVDTFYHPATDAERTSSVATTIFAAWFPRFAQGVLNDEGIDRGLSPAVTGDTFTTMTIQLLVTGRGAGNPNALGSFNPATNESVFFDDARTTPEVESSQEIGVRALVETLAFLESAPSETPGEGGFGTATMDEWLWGLRHQVRFESLLADFLGDDDSLGPLLNAFNINTGRLPLAEGIADGDPRFGLEWFPRPGDQFDVDAANPGLDGVTFSHGSGPVFRMVIALGADGVEGQNILPGGQSGLPTMTDFFDDQAALWLANEARPMHYTPDEVAAAAVSRQRFVPGG